MAETTAMFDVSNFPKAGEFINAVLSQKYRVICYGGAVRGGKTFSSIAALMLLHKLYPMSRSAIVRDTQDNLTRNVLPTLDKLLPEKFVKKANQSAPQKWLFKNNSFMQFFAESYDSDKEGKRWNGFELNFILLEQAEELQQSTFEKALERLGSYVLPKGYKQPQPILMITVNPNKGWVKDLIYDRWKNGTLPEDWLYIPAKITDNPYIPESYLQSLQTLKVTNPVKYERFVNGDWEIEEPTGVEFYSSFNRTKHVGHYPFLPSIPIIHLTYDFNSLPYMTQVGIQVVKDEVNRKTQVRIFREWCLRPPNNTAAAVTQAFSNEFKGKNIAVYYYGDASGKNRIPGKGDERAFDDIEEGLLRGGFLHNNSDRVAKRNMNVLKRRDFINDLLEEYKYPDIEIRVDESCVETIKDFEKVKQDMFGKVKEREKDKALGISYEKLGHTSDSLDGFFTEFFDFLLN